MTDMILRRRISPSIAILLSSLCLTLIYNSAYFARVLEVYPLTLNHVPFLLSVVLLQFLMTVIWLQLFNAVFLLRIVLPLVFIGASVAAYFMNNFGLSIDTAMIENTLQTNFDEALDLVTIELLGYIIVLGIIPAVASAFLIRRRGSAMRHLTVSLGYILAAVLLVALLILLFYKTYSSFFRAHKPVRYYSNPLYWNYSIGKYLYAMNSPKQESLQKIGSDARIPAEDFDRELIIVVVGETARADHFELNGYARPTNPVLRTKGVVSFTNVSSCGTSTAQSVPCMFSILNEDDFSTARAARQENLLDVLNHAGVSILWRDNNSSSKGVADRVTYQNYRSGDLNPVCDIECRDIGMLDGLQTYVDAQPGGDILIVLHQMGNHGPAYFKRYPPEFEVFTPVCKTAELQSCENAEIINAYDNAIRYTDYFLGRTIDFLQANDTRFETALLYVSDHGESLGENGVYLHGMPSLFAPESQTHVPMLLWLGENYEHVDRAALMKRISQPLSHDNLFHTVLGLFEIRTSVYDPAQDIIVHQD